MRKYLALAVVSLFVSLLFLEAPGSVDVQDAWLPWMDSLQKLGLTAGYASFDDMYPPGTAILLQLAMRLGPPVSHFFVLTSLVDAAQFGAVLLFAFYSKSLRLSLAFVLATALSSSALMYLDVLFAMPLLVALYATLDRRPTIAASAFVVACLIKWQPLVLLPFLAILWLEQTRARGWKPVAALAIMPALLGGSIVLVFWPATWEAFLEALEGTAWSGNALNLAWLLQVLHGKPPTALFDLDESWLWALKAIFAVIYLPILAIAALRHRREPLAMLEYAMAGFLAYYLLSSSVHENHLYVAMVLGFVLWSRKPSFAPYAIAIAVFSNLNLFLFFGLVGAPPFQETPIFAVVTASLSAVALLACAVGCYRLLLVGDLAPQCCDGSLHGSDQLPRVSPQPRREN